MKTAAIALVLASSVASADPIVVVPTCVEIDPARDQLPESQRERARMLLVRALEQADQLIVETGCQNTIRLSHRPEGALVHVQIENGRAQQTSLVGWNADMSATYKAMVAALLAPPPPIEEPTVEVQATPLYPSIEANIPSPDPEQVVRVRRFYLHYGAATLADRTGSRWAFGWRRGSETVVDFGFAVTNADDASSIALRLQALRYTSPSNWASGYWGGGLSLGATSIDRMYTSGSDGNGGLQIEGTVGLEWNRRGSLPVSTELNLGMPLYMARGLYPATLVASLGIAM